MICLATLRIDLHMVLLYESTYYPVNNERIVVYVSNTGLVMLCAQVRGTRYYDPDEDEAIGAL